MPEEHRDGAVWHNLASIDLNEGNYPAARDGFRRSLVIEQPIDNLAGEAATWHQLGFVAWEAGQRADGCQLVGLSFAILKEIGAANAGQTLENFSSMCGVLNYTVEQAQAILQVVVESYRADRGRTMLREAFSDSEERSQD